MTTENILRRLHGLGMPATALIGDTWEIAINAAGERVIGIDADEVTGIIADGTLEQWQALFSGEHQGELAPPPPPTPASDDPPSYHDVVVYVNGEAHKISGNYAYKLTCTKVGGWELWFHPQSDWNGISDTSKRPPVPPISGPQTPILLGGEFNSDDFRIEVCGILVCASRNGDDTDV